MKPNWKSIAAICAVLTVTSSILGGCSGGNADDAKAGVDKGDTVVNYRRGTPDGSKKNAKSPMATKNGDEGGQ